MKEDGRGLAAWADGDMAAAPVLGPAPSVTDTVGPVGGAVCRGGEGDGKQHPGTRPAQLRLPCTDPSSHSVPPGCGATSTRRVTPSAQGLLSGAHESPGPDAQSQSRYPPALPPALVLRGGSQGPHPQKQPLHPEAQGLLPAASRWGGHSGGGALQFHGQQPGDK